MEVSISKALTAIAGKSDTIVIFRNTITGNSFEYCLKQPENRPTERRIAFAGNDKFHSYHLGEINFAFNFEGVDYNETELKLHSREWPTDVFMAVWQRIITKKCEPYIKINVI